jgi:F-type H+-transporting ATPase subunit c
MNKWTTSLPIITAMMLISPVAMAQDGAAAGGYIGLGAGLAMGLAVLGGGLGQGNAAKGVYESISRNPGAAGQLNGPFYVGMAFIESLVLFTLVIAFLLWTKI